jgi:hypothetical protein
MERRKASQDFPLISKPLSIELIYQQFIAPQQLITWPLT